MDTHCLLNPLTDFNGEKLVDTHFVASYVLSAYEEVVHWRSNIFWFHLGRLGGVLCLSSLDYIMLLLKIQLSILLLYDEVEPGIHLRRRID